MKGLLLKDFLNIKTYGKSMGMIIIIFAIVALVTGNTLFLSTMMLVFSTMVPLSAINMDEQSKWNAYAQCMPVTRRETVLSKYLLILMISFATVIISLLVNLINSLRFTVDWSTVLPLNLGMLGVVLILAAILMPIIFKLGTEKARYAIMILYMAVMLPVFLLDFSNLPSFVNVLLQYAVYILPVVIVAGLIASYFISVRIYGQKEF